MRKLFSTLLILIVSVAFLNADIYIKQKVHSDPVTMMGQTQPAKDEISEIWIGDDKFATLGEERSTIIDSKKKVMYWINNKNKTYVEMTLPLNMADYMPEQMGQMMQSMMSSIQITVNPNGQKKVIGSWNCDGYDVTMNIMMMKMNMQVWASTEVSFDWEKVGEKMMTNYFKAQFRIDDSAIEEFKKIKGYWIYTETIMNVMGADMKSSTEVLEITKKSAPSAVYSVPAGYTKQDKLSMMDMK